MSFTFEARTLLELGKELISSDEVALYELIKNSIDAQSERVEISIDVIITHTDYREALARIEEGRPLDDIATYVESCLIEHPERNARDFIGKLRAENKPKEFKAALNAHYRRLNTITIRDRGSGMTLDDLQNIYLRVGTRSRRQENLEGARNLGDKGIGRLSAMRLGDQLRIVTSEAGEGRWNELDVDWSLFAHDVTKSIDEIEIEPTMGEEKLEANDHGTIVTISDLQADWTEARFADLLQGRIARMVDPFEPGLANKLIVARHNGTRISIPSVPKPLLDSAHAYCHVDFQMIDGEPRLTGIVDYRYRHRKINIDVKGAEVYSLAQNAIKRRAKRGHAAYKLLALRPKAFEELEAFSCDIYWFNRRVVQAVAGLTEKMSETRREISNWSGGPMLYRYGFRILPYGDPTNDWLDLDENAFGSSGFKLNRQQVLGRVLLDTPHTALSEQTNREGLIQSDAADALRKILMWLVHVELRGLINEADNIEQIEKRAADEDTKLIRVTQERVDRAIDNFKEVAGDVALAEVDELTKSVRQLSNRSASLVKRVENVISEADDERDKFVYLAGIGLMTEFIFHELERAVSHTMSLLSEGSLRKASIDSLKDQLKTLHKRIAAFDELTGEKRQAKSRFDLADLIDEVLSNHEKEFARHGIGVRFERPEGTYVIKAVRGMVIQILENLIANASYWLKQQKRFEPDFEPYLTVSLDDTDKCISIQDNGPGVTEDRAERIFQPFITSKPTGQGRGLGLYISRELAQHHGWKLCMSEEVGNIRKDRINTFILDMGE